MIETLKNLFKKPFTKKYPKEKPKIPKRFRGKLIVNKKKCKACGICRVFCPTGAIKLRTKIEAMKSKGKIYKLISHPIRSIDMGKCVSCGLCVEICPTDAIKFKNGFVSPTKNKKKLIIKGNLQ